MGHTAVSILRYTVYVHVHVHIFIYVTDALSTMLRLLGEETAEAS